MFYEDGKNLPSVYKLVPHQWDENDSRIVAFSVSYEDIDPRKTKKVTFVYGQNGPVVHKGEKVKVLRVGTKYFAKPDTSLEFALEEAKKNGAITILDPFSVPKVDYETLARFDGVYWDAQVLLGCTSFTCKRKEQEKNTSELEEFNYTKMIPVSNAHMPYFGRPSRKRLTEIGKSFIKFRDIEFKNSSELVGNLKEIIEEGRHQYVDEYGFEPHCEYSSLPKILAWKWRIKARKLLKIFGISSFDYTWPEASKDPIVRVES